MALPRYRIGVLVLLGAGLFGGAAAVAEPLLGLPNSFTALGAPWLVCAFAVGSLLPGRRRAAIAGALLLSGATGVYSGAQVYGYGLDSMQYATTMAAAWGVTAGFAGAVLALAGSVWRGALPSGPRRRESCCSRSCSRSSRPSCAATCAPPAGTARDGSPAKMAGMSRRSIAIVAAFFGLAYAISSIVRGQVLSGIVTGAIAGVLVFLVLVRVTEHNDAVRRRREREQR